MARKLSPTEDAAFRLVEQTLGVVVDHYDDGTANKMVDGHIRYPDGRQAALEITTLADKAQMQSVAMLTKDKYKWPVEGVNWTWFVTLRGSVSHKQLKVELSELLSRCEAMGITQTSDSRVWDPTIELASPTVLDWIRANDLQLHGDPKLANNGTVWVMNDGISGVVPSLDIVPPWISKELNTPAMQENIHKLLGDGVPETHLFLWVEWYGAPPEVVLALLDSQGSPEQAPVLPDELSWIWIAANGAPAFWAWSRGTGWVRVQLQGSRP